MLRVCGSFPSGMEGASCRDGGFWAGSSGKGCVCVRVCVHSACVHCPHRCCSYHTSAPWAFTAVQAGAITAVFTHSSQNATALRMVCAMEDCMAMASASVLRAGLENAVKPG